MNGICAHAGCFRSGTWIDEDDGRGYCGEHIIYVAPGKDDEARREVREEIADELRGERLDEIARRSW